MIKTEKNDEAVALEAAHLFAKQFKTAVSKSNKFSVVLSGGRTPKRTFEHLAGADFKDKIDWSLVHVFWGDERCVPLNDPRSNYKMADDTFLSRVNIPADQIHPMICAQEPYQGALDYELQLRDYFDDTPPAFDLVFLGLGTDGHTASLFPESTALKEKVRWVTFLQNPGEDFARLSLTPQILNLSQMTVFLATGKDKRQILGEILAPESEYKYPAQLIQPENGNLIWLVDTEAYSTSLENNP